MTSKKSFYIPAGMTVNGTFTVDVPGQIAGVVNGDVLVNGRLIVLKNAIINGNVEAHELEIRGSITGNIHCIGKMILQNNSFVKGDISTIEIHIEKNAVVDGIITKPGFNTEVQVGVQEEEDTVVEINDTPQILIQEQVLSTVETEEAQSWF